ncbi:hypothetical protein [Cryptosporangium arvum]|uniref:hypothetical protein n=1 Tax=Cryptosporangium arvum TaxID=80871 RepID=UPI000562F7FD|nr:hypothetical protein [Cryptosporangium arvum]
MRPTLHDSAAQDSAEDVVRRFAAGLQRAGDTLDADAYDRWFADDVLWGSPYGATLAGFAPLNEIHRRMMAGARGAVDPDAPPVGAPPVGAPPVGAPPVGAPASRFEVVAVRVPAPGVIVAQLRRRAVAEGGFSEMALYVLVERDGAWWLAAAQNTPIVSGR